MKPCRAVKFTALPVYTHRTHQNTLSLYAVAQLCELCEWPSSRCVSDSSRYIRWRARYAARRL
eukprot:scaffold36024_cov75-Phaeocystis_antarctica.AAC.1